MKTRFLTALTHELPRTDFLPSTRLSHLKTSHVSGSIETPRRPCDTRLRQERLEPPRSRVEPQDWWRFACTWRNKEVDNYIPAAPRRKFFHCLAGGIASIVVLLLGGCQGSKPQPAYRDLNDVPQVKVMRAQMITVTNRLNATLLQAPTNFFTLGPGDKLDIEMPDDTNSLTTTVVGPDGKVYFNLLPGIDVWGLTLGQTRQALQHELRKYVRGEPQINVTLRDVQSKRVWLLGRFQQPGVYSLTGPTRVLEAVAAAGGSQSFAGQRQISEGGPLGEDLADLHHSFLIRNGRMLPIDFYALLDKGDLTQNIYLEPDDFIYFAPAYAKEVYVLGAVTQPQPVPYVQGMTLIQAITGAFGTIRDAYLFHVTIVRGSLAKPGISVVNYYDIVKGKTPDIALEPNDIVYVPFAPYRYLRKYLDTALDTFASSVALNAGTKLSTPSGGASSVTIGIPIGIPTSTISSPVPPIH
jgi:protein involved in polysaccharide export with SLBB domain